MNSFPVPYPEAFSLGNPLPFLLLCSCIYSLFTLLDFKKLVVLDVLIYSIALMLEFVALIRLRWRRPDLDRPFKIPGGWVGLTLATCAFAAFSSACMIFILYGENESWRQMAIAGAMLLSGPLVYLLATRGRKGTAKTDWVHD